MSKLAQVQSMNAGGGELLEGLQELLGHRAQLEQLVQRQDKRLAYNEKVVRHCVEMLIEKDKSHRALLQSQKLLIEASDRAVRRLGAVQIAPRKTANKKLSAAAKNAETIVVLAAMVGVAVGVAWVARATFGG